MRKKNRGFTLIELLAVIIILGILMIIAVPSVTEYISDARKKAYVSTISSYVQSVSVKMLAFGFDQKPSINQALLVPFSEIKMEKKAVSPYGKFLEEQCYIIVLAADGVTYVTCLNYNWNIPEVKAEYDIKVYSELWLDYITDYPAKYRVNAGAASDNGINFTFYKEGFLDSNTINSGPFEFLD